MTEEEAAAQQAAVLAAYGATPQDRERVGFPNFTYPPVAAQPEVSLATPPAPQPRAPSMAAGLLLGNAGMIPGQGEGETESAANIGRNLVTARQATGRALEQMPESTSAINPAIPFLSRALGGLLNAPDLSEQMRENEARLQEAYRQAGAVTPEQQSMFRMTHTEFMDPLGQQFTGFLGNIHGVNPNRLNLWHGTRDPASARGIELGGFQQGGSAELRIPGTSMATDPMMSYRMFGGQDPLRMLRSRADVDPSTVRNLSPGEYSASGMEGIDPSTFRATSKPQSYYQETELFFPQQSGGQASLTDIRGLTPQERAALQRRQVSREELDLASQDYGQRLASTGVEPQYWDPDSVRDLVRRPPTPAEGLELLRRRAQDATRYDRPQMPSMIAEQAEWSLATPRVSDTWDLVFPEDMARLADIHRRARGLENTYTTQQFLGENIAQGAESLRGRPVPPEMRMVMNQQNNMYRQFTAANEPFIRGLQDLPVPPASRLEQQQTMRDMIRNSASGGMSFRTVAERIVPEMQSLGYTPQQIRSIVRELDTFNLAARPATQIRRTLDQRRQVMDME